MALREGGGGGDVVPTDPAKLQSEFCQWMEKVSANLQDRDQEKLFILIDNADIMIVSSGDCHLNTKQSQMRVVHCCYVTPNRTVSRCLGL